MGEIAINPIHNVHKKYRQMNIVNPYIFTPLGPDYTSYNTSDTDALAYISASGISGTATLNSVHHIFCQLKSWGLYSKINAFWLFKGSTATMQKYNAKNPLDTDAAFRLTFNGTGTYSDNGFQGNGTNAYANTHFNPSVEQTTTSNGITLVVGTNNSAANGEAFEVGATENNSKCSYIYVKRNNSTYSKQAAFNANSGTETTGVNESRGIFTGNRYPGDAFTKFFRNGILLNPLQSATGTLPNLNIFIGCVAAPTAYAFTGQRIQMVFMHSGLTDAEITALYNIIDASENIAGRKTW